METPEPPHQSQEELRTAGQRRVNLIWEYSQAIIAMIVVTATIAYNFFLLFVKETNNSDKATVMLSNAFFLVIGFYFGRTNHERIGDQPRRGLDDR